MVMKLQRFFLSLIERLYLSKRWLTIVNTFLKNEIIFWSDQQCGSADLRISHVSLFFQSKIMIHTLNSITISGDHSSRWSVVELKKLRGLSKTQWNWVLKRLIECVDQTKWKSNRTSFYITYHFMRRIIFSETWSILFPPRDAFSRNCNMHKYWQLKYSSSLLICTGNQVFITKTPKVKILILLKIHKIENYDEFFLFIWYKSFASEKIEKVVGVHIKSRMIW